MFIHFACSDRRQSNLQFALAKMDSMVSNNGPISAETITVTGIPKTEEVSEINNSKADEMASAIAAVVVEYLFKADVEK